MADPMRGLPEHLVFGEPPHDDGFERRDGFVAVWPTEPGGPSLRHERVGDGIRPDQPNVGRIRVYRCKEPCDLEFLWDLSGSDEVEWASPVYEDAERSGTQVALAPWGAWLYSNRDELAEALPAGIAVDRERTVESRVAGALYVVAGADDPLGVIPWLGELKALEGVRIEPDTVTVFPAAGYPNDPVYNGEGCWAGESEWHLERLGMPRTWSIAQGSPAVKVAVIDFGFYTQHDDLKDALAPQTEWLDVALNSTDVSPPKIQIDSYQDDDPHGTRVAGALAAVNHNSTGIASVAGGVTLVPIRINEQTPPSHPKQFEDAIDAAVARGCRVINISASVVHSTQLEQAVIDAWQAGVVIVAAAGNVESANSLGGGPPSYGVKYPARYPEVMAVGGVDKLDERYDYWGRQYPEHSPRYKGKWGSRYGNELDIVAPAVDIWTTDIPGFEPWAPTGFDLEGPTGEYWRSANMTSIAAPLVSAVAALLFSRYPEQNGAWVRSVIERTAARVRTAEGYEYENDRPASELPPGYVGSTRWNGEMGYGRLDACAALSYAKLAAGRHDWPDRTLPPFLNRCVWPRLFMMAERVLFAVLPGDQSG